MKHLFALHNSIEYQNNLLRIYEKNGGKRVSVLSRRYFFWSILIVFVHGGFRYGLDPNSCSAEWTKSEKDNNLFCQFRYVGVNFNGFFICTGCLYVLFLIIFDLYHRTAFVDYFASTIHENYEYFEYYQRMGNVGLGDMVHEGFLKRMNFSMNPFVSFYFKQGIFDFTMRINRKFHRLVKIIYLIQLLCFIFNIWLLHKTISLLVFILLTAAYISFADYDRQCIGTAFIIYQMEFIQTEYFKYKNEVLTRLTMIENISTTILLTRFVIRYNHERWRLTKIFQDFDKKLSRDLFCLFIFLNVLMNISGFICLTMMNDSLSNIILLNVWLIIVIQLILVALLSKFFIKISTYLLSTKPVLHRIQIRQHGLAKKIVIMDMIESVYSRRVFRFRFGYFGKITERNISQAGLWYGSIFMMILPRLLR